MNADFEAEIRRLLEDGRKIEAIQHYRDHTGAGLKEAKEAVEMLEREGRLPVAERRGLPNVSEEIVSLLEQGRKIEAIKLYREQSGAGLKEAKEAVEEIGRQRGIAMKSGCLGVILVGIGLGLLAFTCG
jgi:ribosomal protein L7/L12